MIETMLNHIGQGKDFQTQIGGNCGWKFFLRQYIFLLNLLELCASLLSHLQSNYTIYFYSGQSKTPLSLLFKSFLTIFKVVFIVFIKKVKK